MEMAAPGGGPHAGSAASHTIRDLLQSARAAGRRVLSEHESKLVVAEAGVPTVREALVATPDEAVRAARELGFPVVAKVCAPELAHKTEHGLVRLRLENEAALRSACGELFALAPPGAGVLVQPQLSTDRELVVGAHRDPDFGPCVMLGLGGIFTEALRDVVFRLAPLSDADVGAMLDGLRGSALLGPLRGRPGIDRATLGAALRGLGRLLVEHEEIAEIDVNPLLVVDGEPVAVDAMVALGSEEPRRRRPPTLPSSDLGRLLSPRRVAVVGVSARDFGFGRGILEALVAMGFEGELYPVNPRGGEIHGLRVSPTVEDIPGAIDFAIIAVPAEATPSALEACRRKGAAAAEVLSAGFAETGTEEGIALEQELTRVAARGVRVIGPNCFGVYRPANGLTFLPGPDLSREPGGLGFISQSGGMAMDLANVGTWAGLRFSTVVSFGNGCDVRETELLSRLGEDPQTEVVALYLEGVADGRGFYEVLQRVATSKPVLVCKGGLSDAGARAVASHTASMGGRPVIWQAVLEQCNAVQVRNLPELAETALAFDMLPRRPLSGVAIVGGGGGLGVAAADLSDRLGLRLPPFGPDLARAISAELPQPGSSAANPVDVANPLTPPGTLERILTLAGSCTDVDVQVVILQPHHFRAPARMHGVPISDLFDPRAMAEALVRGRSNGGRPVTVVLENYRRNADALPIEALARDLRRRCLEARIPVFDELQAVLGAIARVGRYWRRRAPAAG